MFPVTGRAVGGEVLLRWIWPRSGVDADSGQCLGGEDGETKARATPGPDSRGAPASLYGDVDGSGPRSDRRDPGVLRNVWTRISHRCADDDEENVESYLTHFSKR